MIVNFKEGCRMKTYSFKKCVRFSAIAFAFFYLPFFTNVYAQHYSEIYLSNGEHVRSDNPKGTAYSVITQDGKIQSVHTENSEEVVRVIVTFKDLPLSVYKVKKSLLQKTSLASAYASLQTSHASFRTSLNTIRQSMK